MTFIIKLAISLKTTGHMEPVRVLPVAVWIFLPEYKRGWDESEVEGRGGGGCCVFVKIPQAQCCLQECHAKAAMLIQYHASLYQLMRSSS